MNRFSAILGIAALFVSAVSNAGTSAGTITSMYVHGPNAAYTASSEGVLMFSTAGAQTNPSPCSAHGEWAISLDTVLGRAMEATLKTALAKNKSVTVVGANNCDDWIDREKPAYIRIGSAAASTSDWYTIRNKNTNTCVQATTSNGPLTMAPCNTGDIKQRFVVTPTTWDLNPANDDYHHIESVAFPGHYMYRPYTASGHFSLGTTLDWTYRIELKAFDSSIIAAAAVDARWKKMTVHNYVWPFFHSACATTVIPSAEMDSTWGNCLGQPIGISGGLRTNFLVFQFKRPDGSIGYFNDPQP